MKLLKYIIVTILAIPLFAFATPTSWDFTSGVLQPLKSAWNAHIKGAYFTSTSTTQTNTFPRYTATHGTTTNATSTNLYISGTFYGVGLSDCDLDTQTVSYDITTGTFGCGDDDTSAGAGSGTISTSTNPTIGDLAYWNGLNTIGSVATGTLTETATGLELSATRGLVGGASILSLTSGFGIPLTASTTNWNTFYDTPSNRITAGTNLSWSGNTLNSPSDGVSNWLFNGTRLTPSTTVGIGVFASSTIGGATGATGLTINGGATTTGNAYFGGNVGIGTTTPSSFFQLFSTATTTASFDSSSASKGSCLEMKDRDGSGYTYLTFNNGQMFTSQTSCK